MSKKPFLRVLGAAACLLAPLSVDPVWAGPSSPAPAVRPEAVCLLQSGNAHRCSAPRLPEVARAEALGGPAAVRRNAALQLRRAALSREETVLGPQGIAVRFATSPLALNGIDRRDANGNDVPDVVDAAILGLEQSIDLVSTRLGLAVPANLEVRFLELGEGLDGYLATGQGGPTLVLDSTPSAGEEGVHRATIHLFARASATGLPSGWAEALAVWARVELERGIDASMLGLLQERAANLNAGLLTTDPRLAAGNALWLAYVDEALGPAAVRFTVEELTAAAGATEAALDRAVRRAGGASLSDAFREFQLWTVLTGSRADEQHFRFAGRISGPRFASASTGLPALSVRRDSPIEPLGGAVVQIRPETTEGGLRVDFEGDLAADWEVDLLLIGRSGSMHRIALEVGETGRVETTVPLQGLREALLLIRNLGSSDRQPHRYTYAAQRDAGFPFELVNASAVPQADGVLIHWETAGERHLFGFNVVRQLEDGGPALTVNPVWIPALGGVGGSTSYSFLDVSASPDRRYRYHVQGVTRDGLTVSSEPVAID